MQTNLLSDVKVLLDLEPYNTKRKGSSKYGAVAGRVVIVCSTAKTLLLTPKSFEVAGRPEYVEIYVDRANNAIGLKKTTADGRGYKVNNDGKPHTMKSIGTVQLIRDFKLYDKGHKNVYPAQLYNGGLVFFTNYIERL